MDQHPREDTAAISALHLLRSYNQLLQPPGAELSGPLYPLCWRHSMLRDFSELSPFVLLDTVIGLHYSPYEPMSPPRLAEPSESPPAVLTTIGFSPVLAGGFQPYAALHFRGDSVQECKARRIYMNVNPLLVSGSNLCPRRTRGEKKAIPDEQKDEKYFERRKRNNQAAKKSRDARKIREDQVALKATFLEHENAMLRAQLLTMREETQTLRRLLLMYRKPDPCAIVEDGKDGVVSSATSLCLPTRLAKEGFE